MVCDCIGGDNELFRCRVTNDISGGGNRQKEPLLMMGVGNWVILSKLMDDDELDRSRLTASCSTVDRTELAELVAVSLSLVLALSTSMVKEGEPSCFGGR